MSSTLCRALTAFGLLAFFLGACAPTMRTVTINVAPESVTVAAVPYIATGDSLRVVVIDRAFANRYVARDSAGSLVGMDRAPLFGETTLKTISVGFPFSRALAMESPQLTGQLPQHLNGTMALAGRGRENANAAARAVLLRLARAVTDLNHRSTRISARLDTLRDRAKGDPAERARLGLLYDSTWVPAARAVARDAAPEQIRALVDSLGNAPSPATILPSRYFVARQQAERYGRVVDALRLLMPVEQLAGITDSSSVPRLLSDIAADVASYDRSAGDRRDALAQLAQIRLNEPARAVLASIPAPKPRLPVVVLGMDLGEILASPTALHDRIDIVRSVVAEVNRSTAVVAGAMTLLPRWTDNPDSQTVVTRIYPSESDVRIVVLRRDRFAPWTMGAIPSAAPSKPAPAQTTQTSSANGTTITTVTTITPPAGSGGVESKPGDPGATKGSGTTVSTPSFATLAAPNGNDTVAVLSVPVLQRYRFHLGVGMVYSFLKTTAFETRADTVNGEPGERVLRVGTDEDRLLPVAILSYTLFPIEGRFVDRRARRYPWQNPSLQIQGGLALQHPTEQLYAGLAVELFPGLETGVGFNWAYVETSSRANGEFVPFSTGPATSKEWSRGTAVSVTLDATTFVKAFGGLLGL